MELRELIGKRILSGVETGITDYKSEYPDEPEQVNFITFVLGGINYQAIEDPNDGYRSSMRELRIVGSCNNLFDPIEVFCIYCERDRQGGYDSADILEVYDALTAKLILEVGTAHTSDYYPSFVASFHPENMWHNRSR